MDYENIGAGASQQGYGNYNPTPQPNGTKAYGIACLVCGILSLVCCCCNQYLTIAVSIAAIVLFVLERVFVKKTSGLAIGGLVCSIISIVIALFGLIIGFYLESSGVLDSMTDMLDSILGEYESAYI